MRLFNIGAEGQLYFGAIGAAGIALVLAGQSAWLIIPAMIVAGAACGAAWGAIPGVLRAFAHTNEIITSLMLNYVAALVLNYLIFDSLSYWRDTSPTGQVFPQGKALPDAAAWPTFTLGSVTVPFGFFVAIVVAAVVWVLYTRTRFGFEAQVIGDSPRAARYAGMRTRRKIVAVLCLSGAIAGIGGASQDGDFRHVLDAARAPAGELRVHGDRRRGPGPLQPVRDAARRLPARRARERRLHAAGRGLPVRPRRRDAGDDPVRDARRRAPRPLPRRDRPAGVASPAAAEAAR